MKTFKQFISESTKPGEYIYHAAYFPNLAKSLKSIIQRGLEPSKGGYAGPGLYAGYKPDDCFDHVKKEDATMFRMKWKDVLAMYGKVPEKEDGIQLFPEQIVIPGPVPAKLIEVEYFEDEWWSLEEALGFEQQ